jgi:hypothetical protein
MRISLSEFINAHLCEEKLEQTTINKKLFEQQFPFHCHLFQLTLHCYFLSSFYPLSYKSTVVQKNEKQSTLESAASKHGHIREA